MDGSTRSDRRDELPDGRTRTRRSARRPEPGPSMLGDIVLCPSSPPDGCSRRPQPPRRELALLTVHGVLHLLGYDHADPWKGRRRCSPCSGCLRMGCRAGRVPPARPPGRTGSAFARQVPAFLTDLDRIDAAPGRCCVLVLLGGLFSAIDAAINTVSKARVAELVRAERPRRGASGAGSRRTSALHQSRCAASYRV